MPEAETPQNSKGHQDLGIVEFIASNIANVFLSMQLTLSSYFQGCFPIMNDVVMSILLMYEQPESGGSWSIRLYRNLKLRSPLRGHLIKDLMAYKPRNKHTESLMDWQFFQIYLVNLVDCCR